MKVEEFLNGLEGILKEASDGMSNVEPCFYTKPNGDPIVTVQDVSETMAASAFHSTSPVLRGVSCNLTDGGSAVICYTGNGPHSEATAYFIATAFGAVPELMRLLREHQSEIAALRKDRDADQCALNVIQRICGDDFCEDLDMRDMDETMESDLGTAHRKLSAVYRASHSMVRANVCHFMHDDWRKEVLEEAAAIDTNASADVNLSQV